MAANLSYLAGFRRLALLSVLVFQVLVALPQKILLPTGILTFHRLDEEETTRAFWDQTRFGDHFYFALSFLQTPAMTDLQALAKEGTRLLERLAPNIYLAETKEKPDEAWLKRYGLTGVTHLPPTLKLDPRISTQNIPLFGLASKEVVKLMVGLYGQATVPEQMAALGSAGFMVTDSRWVSKGILTGTAPLQALNKIAAIPCVYALWLQGPEDQTLNQIGRASSGTSLLNAPLVQGGRGLSGKGIVVGVGDDSDPSLHPDLTDRIINHTPGMTNNHGAHVTGTVAGAGILNQRLAGFAPQASVVSQWFSGVWQNADVYTTTYNMVATNNSYGSIVGDCLYAGVYDLSSRMLDLQAFEFPQVLHAFASGNDGDNTCAPFPRSYNTVLGGYQSAKNILTVGRTDYTQVSSSSSSSGPVKDGRLKPEITGLGIIQSTNGSGNGYFTEFGTSMSSPNITGGLALLYERYRQLHLGANPRGALMKALLLNGARDVGTPGPDFRHGYGTMMLERSLRMLEKQTYTENTLTQGSIRDTTIQVPAGTSKLQVMLYWHDPAANVLAANTLVHDLDLQVIAPGGQVIFPKILNPAAGLVTQPATEGEDHTNNHEQVIIEDPAPGAYTIRVKGTEVLTSLAQPYVVTFDAVPTELRFTHPLAGATLGAGNVNSPLAWEDEGTPAGSYDLAYSVDDGNNWTPVVTALKDSTRLYFWQPGNIRTTQARLRLSKGATVALSERFSIIPDLSFSAAPLADQCYGYFRINWTALTPAEGETIDYVVLLKKGPAMEPIAEVSGTNTHVIGNLHPDSTYYAAVVARINGQMGMYGTAVSRRPNTGNCNGAISDANLMLDSIVSPLSGRALTSSALTGPIQVKVRVRNLDNAPVNSFNIKYSINGGAFTEAIISTPIPALATFTHTFPSIDISQPGDYTLTAIVQNLSAEDPMPANDTFRMVIRYLPNEPVNLNQPLSEGFESASAIWLQRPALGIAGTARWDYVNQDPLARLRTFVTPGIARSGNRAVSLDVSKATPRVINPFNQLIGTFNLGAYGVNTDEIRLGFYYKFHGITQGPHPQNKVWIRGKDTDEWIELYDLGANQATEAGLWKQVTSLDLNAKLLAAGQQFSSSTQIRFGQYALYSLADNETFGGYTFDDIILLKAQDDLQLTAIVNPGPFACGSNANIPVSITVRNGVPATLTNIPVRYRINNGSWVTETLPSITGKSETNYTFTTTATLSGSGKFTVEAEVNLPTDNIPDNNALAIEVIQQPVISSFPYYEDFENGPAGFVSEGIQNTWEFGQPASLRINEPASGTKAWKTRLTGNYNDLETSYLYSPCFDIAALSFPMLSFSLAYSFEDCRNFPGSPICDAGWMEYSLDGGVRWQKLGAFGEGQSWYDFESGQVWMLSNQTNWREAIIPLPKHNGIIRLRFALSSDFGSTREGLAIDNFHIYNGGPLPLSWISFEAQGTPDQKAALQWRVADARPGDRFDVEVSYTAGNGNFAPAGTVIAGASPTGYLNFLHDPKINQGQVYYRIRWTRQNGEVRISGVRTVRFAYTGSKLIVFPNPASSQITLAGTVMDNGPISLRILHTDGRVLDTRRVSATGGNLNITIDLGPLHLPAGIYLLELRDPQVSRVFKWMKE